MLFRSAVLVAAAALTTSAQVISDSGETRLLAIRHHGDHQEEGHEHEHSHDDAEEDHSHDHDDEESGHDHGSGHDAGAGSYGPFNFTATGITWPHCLQHCCHEYLDFLDPVNNPLCVNADYYQNVTSCVVEDCSEYEQGAYAAVVEMECAGNNSFSASAVRDAVTEAGGQPQDCAGVDNSTIRCDNGTSEEQNEGDDGASTGVTAARITGQTWFIGVVLVAIPLGLLF